MKHIWGSAQNHVMMWGRTVHYSLSFRYLFKWVHIHESCFSDSGAEISAPAACKRTKCFSFTRVRASEWKSTKVWWLALLPHSKTFLCLSPYAKRRVAFCAVCMFSPCLREFSLLWNGGMHFIRNITNSGFKLLHITRKPQTWKKSADRPKDSHSLAYPTPPSLWGPVTAQTFDHANQRTSGTILTDLGWHRTPPPPHTNSIRTLWAKQPNVRRWC